LYLVQDLVRQFSPLGLAKFAGGEWQISPQAIFAAGEIATG
jgi:hypothetical protein